MVIRSNKWFTESTTSHGVLSNPWWEEEEEEEDEEKEEEGDEKRKSGDRWSPR